MELEMKDLYGYINEINGGYINVGYHPDNDNIVILNYSPIATHEKRWNKYTMSARGLILDLTSVRDNGKIKVLAQPFEKFFNYGENKEYESSIDFSRVESVMEKMDGSLGISYIVDGKISFATRGSFISDQAKKATEMWHSRYAEANKKYHKFFTDSKPTLLVEIIYPSNRIVVDYKGEEKLVLLGVIDEGVDYHAKAVQDVGNALGLPVAKQYEYTLDEMVEMKKNISANEEGWIVRFNDNKRLKIKGDEYMNVHRVAYGLSDKLKVEAWKDGLMDDLIFMMPEEFRAEIENLKKGLDMQAETMRNMVEALYESVIELYKSKKDFAVFVNSGINQEYRKFMFMAYKNEGEVPMSFIREHIYKNYRDYIEVIRWNSDS